MTSKDLDALNRRTRVIALLRRGLPYREVAEIEGCSQQTVSRIAIRAGLRRQAEKRSAR